MKPSPPGDALGALEVKETIISSLADPVHFFGLKERLLPLPDSGEVSFDGRHAAESYAQLFNRLSHPLGADASALDRAMAELKRDVQVIPGIQCRKKRWKLLCLAVSTPWLDPHLDCPFPGLRDGMALVDALIGQHANLCTDVQIVTFTEWNDARSAQSLILEKRLWAIGNRLAQSGVRLEVFTWDMNRFGWTPDVNDKGQPLMTGRELPGHWRRNTWGPPRP